MTETLKNEIIKLFPGQDIDKFDIRYNAIPYDKISIEFIKEFMPYLDWFYITRSSYLTEEFMEEFKDKIDSEGIACHQKLSKEFRVGSN